MNMNPSNSPSSPAPSRPGRWRAARRLLVAGAAAATLIAVFYTVEDWRGKRAWENCRRELEAKGEVLDWAAHIPAPVPDDQNIFKAPKMQEWFVKESPYSKTSGAVRDAALRNAPRPFMVFPPKDTYPVVAEVRIAASNAPVNSQPGDAVLRFDDPAAREQAAKLLRDALGPCAVGVKSCFLVARPLDQIKPLRWVLQADTLPGIKELTAFLSANPISHWAPAWSESSCWQVGAAGSNLFHVSPDQRVYAAADYLAWTEPLRADFDVVRKALERPFARIDGDYEQPFLIPIPNFVRMRDVAQTLSQRAQCCLLLGQPEAARHELALVRDSCRIMEVKPPGKPMTLVAAVIETAVTGLYVGIVQDGLRLHAWREPQLLAIERQLKDTDLLSPLVDAFRAERAASCRTFEITKTRELARLYSLERFPRDLGDGSRNLQTLLLTWMPRGWYYQNMAVGAGVMQEFLGCVDPTNQLLLPHQIDKYDRELQARFQHGSPYTFLAAPGAPNFLHALQTVAQKQTLVNQARLACALERYRLAQGHYPESLDALTPRFIEKPPHDLIGGQPLKYRRTNGGGYLLYSVGWDEKDSGGVPGKSREEGDWVWELR